MSGIIEGVKVTGRSATDPAATALVDVLNEIGIPSEPSPLYPASNMFSRPDSISVVIGIGEN